jgi:nickel-dependent lactate racemase
MRVTIAFTDATRHSPDAMLIGTMLDELAERGVGRDDVTLLCATGLHRPSTDAERRAKLGDAIVESVRIVDHDASDASQLADLGSVDGLPVVVNRLCVECDELLATGVVEPHQYAGYSGGAKTVAIGCGGEATIAATHGPAMIDREGVRLGAIDGNPFQRFVRAAGRRIGLRNVANVVLDESGRMIARRSGDPIAVHDELVAIARTAFERHVPETAHIVVAGVPDAKASNLYQASRAATYVALAERTPLLPGGVIVIPASIAAGAGAGLGERRFLELLSGASEPRELVRRLARDGFPGGAQRAYVLAKVLAGHTVIIAGGGDPAVVRACHMIPCADLADALELARATARAHFGVEPRVLEIANALVTLPRLASGPGVSVQHHRRA